MVVDCIALKKQLDSFLKKNKIDPNISKKIENIIYNPKKNVLTTVDEIKTFKKFVDIAKWKLDDDVLDFFRNTLNISEMNKIKNAYKSSFYKSNIYTSLYWNYSRKLLSDIDSLKKIAKSNPKKAIDKANKIIKDWDKLKKTAREKLEGDKKIFKRWRKSWEIETDLKKLFPEATPELQFWFNKVSNISDVNEFINSLENNLSYINRKMYNEALVAKNTESTWKNMYDNINEMWYKISDDAQRQSIWDITQRLISNRADIRRISEWTVIKELSDTLKWMWIEDFSINPINEAGFMVSYKWKNIMIPNDFNLKDPQLNRMKFLQDTADNVDKIWTTIPEQVIQIPEVSSNILSDIQNQILKDTWFEDELISWIYWAKDNFWTKALNWTDRKLWFITTNADRLKLRHPYMYNIVNTYESKAIGFLNEFSNKYLNKKNIEWLYNQIWKFVSDYKSNPLKYEIIFTMQEQILKDPKLFNEIIWQYDELIAKWLSSNEIANAMSNFFKNNYNIKDFGAKLSLTWRQIKESIAWQTQWAFITMKWISDKLEWKVTTFSKLIDVFESWVSNLFKSVYEDWYWLIVDDVFLQKIQQLVKQDMFTNKYNVYTEVSWLVSWIKEFDSINSKIVWELPNLRLKRIKDSLAEVFWEKWAKKIYEDLTLTVDLYKGRKKHLLFFRKMFYFLWTTYTPSWLVLAWQNVWSWIIQGLSFFNYKWNWYKQFNDVLYMLKWLDDPDMNKLIQELWSWNDVLLDNIAKNIDIEKMRWSIPIYWTVVDSIWNILWKLMDFTKNKFKLSDKQLLDIWIRDVEKFKRQTKALLESWFMWAWDKLVELMGLKKWMYNKILFEKWINMKTLKEYIWIIKNSKDVDLVRQAKRRLTDILSWTKKEVETLYKRFYTTWAMRWLMRNDWSRRVLWNTFSSWWAKKTWEYLYNWLFKAFNDAVHISKKHNLSRLEAAKVFTHWLFNDHTVSVLNSMLLSTKFWYQLNKVDDENWNEENFSRVILESNPLVWGMKSFLLTRSGLSAIKWYNTAKELWFDTPQSIALWLENWFRGLMTNFLKEVKTIATAPIYSWIQWYHRYEDPWLAFDIALQAVVRRWRWSMRYLMYDVYQNVNYERMDIRNPSVWIDIAMWEAYTAQKMNTTEFIDKVYLSRRTWDKPLDIFVNSLEWIADTLFVWSRYPLWIWNQTVLERIRWFLKNDEDYIKLEDRDISVLDNKAKLKFFKDIEDWRYLWAFDWKEPNTRTQRKVAAIMNDMEKNWTDIHKFNQIINSWLLSRTKQEEAMLILEWTTWTKAESAIVLSYLMRQAYEEQEKAIVSELWVRSLPDDIKDWIRIDLINQFWPLFLQLDKSAHAKVITDYLREKYPKYISEDAATARTSTLRRAVDLEIMTWLVDLGKIDWDRRLFNNIWAFLLSNVPDELAPKMVADYFGEIDNMKWHTEEAKSVIKAGILYWNRNRLMQLYTSEYWGIFEWGLEKLAEIIWDTDDKLAELNPFDAIAIRSWWAKQSRSWKKLKWAEDMWYVDPKLPQEVNDVISKMRDHISKTQPQIADKVIRNRLWQTNFKPLPKIDEITTPEYTADLKPIRTAPIKTKTFDAKKWKPVKRRWKIESKRLFRWEDPGKKFI